MDNTTFNRWFLPSICVAIWIYFVYHSPWRVRIWWKMINNGLHSGDQKIVRFVSLSVLFNQHSGAIYLRSKSYLFVRISAHIVTTIAVTYAFYLWCICCCDCRLCADMVSHCAIRKLEYHVVWLHSDRPLWEMIWKIFFTFDFQILP